MNRDAVRAPRASLPAGDVRLADERLLRRTQAWPVASAAALLGEQTARRSAGYVYEGPKHLRVIASIDDTDQWGPLLHLSLSYPDRNPSWRDIRQVKDAFYGPERDAMMVLPRQALYVNVHEHCMQMWECPETWEMM